MALSDKLITEIDRLGALPCEKIRDEIADAGVKGIRKYPARCVLARYLGLRCPSDASILVTMAYGHVYVAVFGDEYKSPSKSLCSFALQFDSNRYPDLVSPPYRD